MPNLFQFDNTNPYTILDFIKEIESTIFNSKDEMINTISNKLSTILVDKGNEEYIYKTSCGAVISNGRYRNVIIKYINLDSQLSIMTLMYFLKRYNASLHKVDSVCCKFNNTDPYLFNVFYGIYATPKQTTDITLLLEIFQNIFTNYNFIMNWCKDVCSGIKPKSSLLLYSGLGKNIFTTFLTNYVIGINNTAMVSVANGIQYSEVIARKLLVVANEFTVAGYNKIKWNITKPYIYNVDKYVEKYKIENISNWFFTSALKVDSDKDITCIKVELYYGNDSDSVFANLIKRYYNQDAGNSFLYYILNTEFN